MKEDDIQILENIMVELNHFKFSRRSLSYQYLIEAIYLVVKDKTSIRNFNKNIYVPIAKNIEDLLENSNNANHLLLQYENEFKEFIINFKNIKEIIKKSNEKVIKKIRQKQIIRSFFPIDVFSCSLLLVADNSVTLLFIAFYLSFYGIII